MPTRLDIFTHCPPPSPPTSFRVTKPDCSPPLPPSVGNQAPQVSPLRGREIRPPNHVRREELKRQGCGGDPDAVRLPRPRTDLPLLVQHLLQQAPALPAAGSAAMQAQALRGQLEGAQAAPRRPAGGALAHLASQPLELVQAQKPFGPRALPQLLPKGFQAWGRRAKVVYEGGGRQDGQCAEMDGRMGERSRSARSGVLRPSDRFPRPPHPALGLGGHPLLGFGRGSSSDTE